MDLSETDSEKSNGGSRTRSGITHHQDGTKRRKPLERLVRATTVEKDAGGRQLSGIILCTSKECSGLTSALRSSSASTAWRNRHTAWILRISQIQSGQCCMQ
eukprot:5578255-Pyramimonas_sp.AAC.1